MKQRLLATIFLFFLSSLSLFLNFAAAKPASSKGPIISITIDGPINPATADYLRSSLQKAASENAKLLVLRLNTPGGLLTSMQSMVELILESEVPVAVYVSPRGGGAISAGVFITMAAHFAAMAPGTTIGAAHPVSGSGDDIKGDMREKIENFAVSHIKSIAEERGRNADWAEDAVRESVAITANEAAELKVVDMVVGSFDRLLAEIEGQTISLKGKPISMAGLVQAPVKNIPMTLRQKLVNILSDPNIAILLGLGAILGIGLELYHPGTVLPGICGVICLILSLTAAQVLPINYGGAALLFLALALFAAELFTPAFGIAGGAGILSMVLGAIYLVDTDAVWGAEGFAVDYTMIGFLAFISGAFLLFCSTLAVRSMRLPVVTGRRGMLGETVVVKKDFSFNEQSGFKEGKVKARGEIWKAKIEDDGPDIREGAQLKVKDTQGLTLILERG